MRLRTRAAVALAALTLLSHSGVARAQIEPDTVAWIDWLGLDVDPTEYQGALNSTGLTAEGYALAMGWVEPAPVVADAIEARLDCIAWYESHNTPSARNPRSGAAGLFQFLPGTWAQTPQGRAGLSVYDPVAARAAARWLALAPGKGFGHWAVVLVGLC